MLYHTVKENTSYFGLTCLITIGFKICLGCHDTVQIPSPSLFLEEKSFKVYKIETLTETAVINGEIEYKMATYSFQDPQSLLRTGVMFSQEQKE